MLVYADATVYVFKLTVLLYEFITGKIQNSFLKVTDVLITHIINSCFLVNIDITVLDRKNSTRLMSGLGSSTIVLKYNFVSTCTCT